MIIELLCFQTIPNCHRNNRARIKKLLTYKNYLSKLSVKDVKYNSKCRKASLFKRLINNGLWYLLNTINEHCNCHWGGGAVGTPLSESIVIGVKKCLLNSMYVSKKGTDSGLKGHLSFDKILFRGVGVDFWYCKTKCITYIR